MTEVESFSEIEEEVHRRAQRIVWCTVSTQDRQGRMRSRMLHPIWEGSIAWIMTGRQTLKTKHLARNPWASLCYWDPQHEQIYADCKAEWADDPAEKQRVWDLFKSKPEPYGYDGTMFWPGGPTDDSFGVLKLTPWRLELSAMKAAGFESQIWRPDR